jgi:FkbM family methyltransferase
MLNTRSKIALAAAFSRIVRTARAALGRESKNIQVIRDGISWNLDLNEGIDFAIFLGIYERATTRAIRRWVRPDSVVLDIGANIGAHTLQLARRVGSRGKVIAFEPTFFAHAKLIKSLALNPSLVDIVKAEQLMLVASDSSKIEMAIYSSWPLGIEDHLHPKHLGALQPTNGAGAISLDTYLKRAGILRVDFIKLDVDGFECEVLDGARQCLKNSHPTILMEIAPYCLREHGVSLGQLVSILSDSGYRFMRLDGKEFPLDVPTLESRMVDGSSMNVIARVVK